MPEIIQNDIKIELENIGEGWNGDYDDSDPSDDSLLRFSCYVKGELRQKFLDTNQYGLDDRNDFTDNTEWIGVSDASYCTRLSSNISIEVQDRALQILMNELAGPISKTYGIKSAASEMSWIGPSDINNKV